MMIPVNDVIESSNKNYNVYVNVSPRIRQVDQKAAYVASRMKNTGDVVAYKLYCKAFYMLSEATIMDCVELALERGKDPARYLSWLLSNEIRRTKTTSRS